MFRTTLEKEREKTRAAASAAQNFEQKNRALLLAAAGERKQNNLLQTQAQEMKINHENILKPLLRVVHLIVVQSVAVVFNIPEVLVLVLLRQCRFQLL